jgi:RHS repeat-associated protein
MKRLNQQKTFWVFRLISMILIIAFLFSDATVLSAAMPSIKNFISDTISKISFEKTSDETKTTTNKSTAETQIAGTVINTGTVSGSMSVTDTKKNDTAAKQETIPAQIFALLVKLYDYDKFTEKEIKALYDYLKLDYSKKAEQSEEFNKRLQALFDSLPETTKNDIKLMEIMYKNKHEVYSKCTDAEKQLVYSSLCADISKTNKIDTLMNKLEKAGYKLYDSVLIMQIMDGGVFSYDEAVALYKAYPKRPERDALVRSVKDIAKYFDINNIEDNNFTTTDIYSSVKAVRNDAEKSAKRAEYNKYTNNDAFVLAKKLILQGYTKKNIIIAFSVAAVLGVNPEEIIINDKQAKEASAKELSKAEKDFIDTLPVNLDAVKKILKDKKASGNVSSTSMRIDEYTPNITVQKTLTNKDIAFKNLSQTLSNEVNEDDLSMLMEESIGMGMMLYSMSSTEPEAGKDIEAPFKLNINEDESISLNTGSVNYSETLLNIRGVNGLDLVLSIDYSSCDSNLQLQSYDYGYIETAWYGVEYDYFNYYIDPNDTSLGTYYFYEYGDTITFSSAEDQAVWAASIYEYEEETNLGYHCHGYYIWTDGDYYYYNVTNPKDWTEPNYINGGWSFNIPYINYTNNSNVLCMPGKGNFGFTQSGSTLTFNDYTLDNMVMALDSSYNNGQFTSNYCVTMENGIKYYFATNGLLLCKKDKYGNIIKYNYVFQTVGEISYFVISKITDTIGREVNFTYGTDLVTITMPDNSTIQLTRNSYGGLHKITWQNNTETVFTYTYSSAGFDYFNKENFDLYIDYALLTNVTYSTGAQLVYSYESNTVNLGSEGCQQVYRVTERKLVSDNVEYGKMNYSYVGNYTNYPSTSTTLPTNYTYSTIVTYNNNTSTKYTFNNNNLNTVKQYYNGTTMYKQVTSVFNEDKLPTSVVTVEYSGALSRTTTELYTYDNKGNVLTSISPKAEGNSSTTEYKTTNTYDSNYYSLPLTIEYKQDESTTILKQNTLSADHKSILAESTYVNNVLKAKTEYTYDSYGNVTQKKEYTDVVNNIYITTNYSYADNVSGRNYNGLYLTQTSVTGVRDADGNLVDSTGIVTTGSQYDVMGRLTHSTDAEGNVTQMTYDVRGRLTCLTYPDSTTTSYIYDDVNNDKTVTDQLGNAVKYNYNSIGLLINVTRLSDNTIIASYEYDNRGNVLTEYNAAGESSSSVTVYTYDYKDRMLTKSVRNASAVELYLETYTYTDIDANGNYVVTKTVDGDTHAEDIVTVSYTNKYGETIKQGTVINGSDVYSSTYSEYNYIGQKTRDYYINSNNQQVNIGVYTYDFRGNLTSTTNQENNTSYIVYDALGRKTSESDFKGKYVLYTYDNLGRLVKQEAPIDTANGVYSITKYYYDNNGNVTRKKQSNNADNSEIITYSIVEYEYNSVGKVTDITTHIDDNRAEYVHYEYDNAGNITRMYTGLSVPYSTSLTPADYQLTQYEYNIFGQLIELTDAMGQSETYTYDDNGMLETMTDRNGNQTRYTYNALGSVVTDSVYNIQNTLLTQKTYTYTKTGALYTVSEGGVTMTYTYDEGGRNISVAETGGILKEYEYDNFGNTTLFRLTVNSVVKTITTYSYDAMHRLTGVAENGKTTTYTYDANGNRVAMTMSGCGSVTEYEYNDSNMVTKLTNTVNNVKVSEFTYGYYTDGNQRKKTDTVNQTVTSYVYDGAGRLVSETEIDLNTLVIAHRYQYTYDYANNRLTMAVDGSEVYNVAYTYDKNNRLLTESKSEQESTSTVTSTVVTNTDRGTVTTITSTVVTTITAEVTAYTYDNNGNTLTKTTGSEVITYTYNARNQQTGYSGTVIITYTYNPDGLRRSKQTSGFTLALMFVWSADNMVYEYESLTPTQGTVYVYGINLISSRNNSAVEKYYLYNAHGDVVQLVSSNGTVVKTYKYDAFGVEYTPDANDTNYFRYCGQYFDTESGTYYLRARYYNPANGRFTQQDSWSNGNVGDPLSLNLYSYCKCNPIIYIDLTGCWPTWGQVFAAVAIVAITAVTVAAVVATAGAAGAAVGMAAGMYLGASASTVAAITTVATVGAYGVAAGVAACGLSDAGEALTGTNVIRDYVLKGNQKTYDVLEIGLDVASQIIVGTAIDSGLMNSDDSDDDTPSTSTSSGRAKNRLQPDSDAAGDHSTYRRDPNTGEITHYTTYKTNPQNPTGFDEVTRYDGVGEAHYNKVTHEYVPTPHVQGKTISGGVRAAHPEEIPRKSTK